MNGWGSSTLYRSFPFTYESADCTVNVARTYARPLTSEVACVSSFDNSITTTNCFESQQLAWKLSQRFFPLNFAENFRSLSFEFSSFDSKLDRKEKKEKKNWFVGKSPGEISLLVLRVRGYYRLIRGEIEGYTVGTFSPRARVASWLPRQLGRASTWHDSRCPRQWAARATRPSGVPNSVCPDSVPPG